MIRFERVPLVTPNGDVLIPSLDLEVRYRFLCFQTCRIAVCFDLWKYVRIYIAGSLRHKRPRLWPQRLRQEFAVPCPRRAVAPLRRPSHKTRQGQALLRAAGLKLIWDEFPETVHDPRHPQGSGHLPGQATGHAPKGVGSWERKFQGVSDDDLLAMLDRVQLGYILTREGGWNAVQDWMDVLSGGEKQRIAVSRIPFLEDL